MPKRSGSGLTNGPARVVAPTKVNFASSILTERAAGPSPMMRSSWKSSIAGYSTSSTAGLRRWISSMNSTSRSSRLVRSAARSPALAITGPEVARKLTPSSRATICASVVLPRPGGPTNSTWSSASLRARAASMNTPRLAQAWAWPMTSESRCGRSDASAASSSRRSELTRRREFAFNERALLDVFSARVLVGKQLADRRDRGTIFSRDDDAGVAIVVPDQLAAAPARRHHGDGLIRLGGPRMTDRNDDVDAALADLGDHLSQRDRLGAHRHAAQIGIEVDAGEDASGSGAQRGADFLPVVALTSSDDGACDFHEFNVLRAQEIAQRSISSSISSRIWMRFWPMNGIDGMRVRIVSIAPG